MQEALSSSLVVRTLAVDDDRSMRMMLQIQLEDLGHQVQTACDGREAWECIQREGDNIDVVVIDREMPEMDGLEVVSLMKADPRLKNIPVIMQTGYDSADQIKTGIDAGVYYYLTKPIDEDVLSSVLSAAVREARQQKTLNKELKHHRSSFNLLQDCRFRVQTLSEVEDLSSFLANCFPDPSRVAPGLASLLVNALEHGNLGIGFDLKTKLIETGTWRVEIERRLEIKENRDKFINVQFRRKAQGCSVKVTDCGPGFSWRQYMTIDPARAQNNHGRGIAQAAAISFDQVEFNDMGNEVVGFCGYEPDIEW